MPKIISVTLNTAIDYVVEIDQFISGKVFNANKSVAYPAGKGINLAKALVQLQTPVIALGFVGAGELDVFNRLQSDNLKLDLSPIQGATRINLSIQETKSQQETHIRTAGFTVTNDDCTRLIEHLSTYLSPGDVIVFSGSLPEGVPDNFFESVFERCRKHSVFVILDSSGKAFSIGTQSIPDLIKPNLTEFEELVGARLDNEKQIISAAEQLIQQGIQHVVISCGHQGVIAVNKQGAVSVKVEISSRPVVSQVGCGDCLVAGLALGLLSNNSLADTLKLAVSCATANLYTHEPGLIHVKDVDELKNKVIIRKLK